MAFELYSMLTINAIPQCTVYLHFRFTSNDWPYSKLANCKLVESDNYKASSQHLSCLLTVPSVLVSNKITSKHNALYVRAIKEAATVVIPLKSTQLLPILLMVPMDSCQPNHTKVSCQKLMPINYELNRQDFGRYLNSTSTNHSVVFTNL